MTAPQPQSLENKDNQIVPYSNFLESITVFWPVMLGRIRLSLARNNKGTLGRIGLLGRLGGELQVLL